MVPYHGIVMALNKNEKMSSYFISYLFIIMITNNFGIISFGFLLNTPIDMILIAIGMVRFLLDCDNISLREEDNDGWMLKELLSVLDDDER